MLALKGIKEEIRVPVEAEIQLERKPQKVKFVAIYKRKKHSENKALIDALEERARLQDLIREGQEDPDIELPGKSDDELLREYVVGWVLKGADDEPIEFSEEALNEVIDVTEYREALMRGFMDALSGRRALAKNS